MTEQIKRRITMITEEEAIKIRVAILDKLIETWGFRFSDGQWKEVGRVIDKMHRPIVEKEYNYE